jgi:dephospho-CoA kinase
MTEARMRAILERQLSDAEKRRRADFVVQTGLTKAHSLHQLVAIVRLLRSGRGWPRRRRRWVPGAAV